MKIPELQSLDDRIAALEKKKSLQLKTPEKPPSALAQTPANEDNMFAQAFEDEKIYVQVPDATLI
jgi:uncharacterized coiled-coil protein SlyX